MSSVTLHAVTAANSAQTLPEVLSLIHALALFEKDPDAVEATIELLHRNFGFGETGKNTQYAQCVLAYVGGGPEEGGECVAMACYFFTFSTWTGKGGLYLEDLFVKEAYRSQGISKKLFAYLGQICVDRDLPRMDWVRFEISRTTEGQRSGCR
ncbi:diamine N-acetyltransferase, partial [Phenoliferia sp. Uapishka_3]